MPASKTPLPKGHLQCTEAVCGGAFLIYKSLKHQQCSSSSPTQRVLAGRCAPGPAAAALQAASVELHAGGGALCELAGPAWGCSRQTDRQTNTEPAAMGVCARSSIRQQWLTLLHHRGPGRGATMGAAGASTATCVAPAPVEAAAAALPATAAIW
jgi:hypothetical protein